MGRSQQHHWSRPEVVQDERLPDVSCLMPLWVIVLQVLELPIDFLAAWLLQALLHATSRGSELTVCVCCSAMAE